MKDEVWQSVRYLLIAVGSYLAGRGKLPVAIEDVVPLADAVIEVGGLAVALCSAAWGIYVRYGAKSVPADVAARKDIPTLSTATGAVEK